MSRVIALDHGEARCGVAVSDPTGELVTPLAIVERPDTRKGLARVVDVVREREAALVVVGLPITLAGDEGAQAQAARAFASRLAEAVDVPVELHDERLTTRMAERTGGSAASDSVAAAHLLESWLQTRRAAAAPGEGAA
jgi:putative Holliday junction resolvase